MTEPDVRRSFLARLARHLISPLLLIAVGTPLALWGMAELTESRFWRRPPGGSRGSDGGPLTAEDFRPMEAVPRMPVVAGFETLSADEADRRIRGDELVLAVEVNGQARAWPLNVMTGPEREVFNDQLGGRSIAATW